MELTKKQLKIIEPLKKLVNLKFYNEQVSGMKGTRNCFKPSPFWDYKFSKRQIKNCRKIREQLDDYNESIEYLLDIIDDGTYKLRNLIK